MDVRMLAEMKWTGQSLQKVGTISAKGDFCSTTNSNLDESPKLSEWQFSVPTTCKPLSISQVSLDLASIN